MGSQDTCSMGLSRVREILLYIVSEHFDPAVGGQSSSLCGRLS